MNQPTAYEQLIAQKVQEVEVPELRNSIWATIEHQLNNEMPPDGPGSGGPNNFNWGIGGKGLFTLFVAIATYISVSKQTFDNKRDALQKPKAIEHHKPTQKKLDSLNHLPPLKEKTSKENGAAKVQDAVVAQPKGVDSVQTASNSVLESAPSTPTKADTVVTTRKARGVRGISDADYRLIPTRKDSVKRNE